MGKVGVYLLVIFSVSNANSLGSQAIKLSSQSSYNKHHAQKIQYDSTLLKTHGSSQVLVNTQKNEINGPRISESLVVNRMGNVLNGQVNSDNTPPCGLGQKYKIRYPGSCQKYYECDDGTLVTMSCYWLTNFDVIEQCCRFYYFVDCTITEPPATTSSTSDTTTSSPTQTSTISNQTTSTNRSTSFASITPETSTSPVSTTTSKITSGSPLTSISSTLRSTTYPIISSSPTSTEIPFTSTTTHPTTTTTRSTTIMASTSTSTAPQTPTSHSTVSTSSSQTIPSTVKTSTGAPITRTTFFTTDSHISTSNSSLSTSSPTTISVTTKETVSPTSYPSTTPFPYDPRCSPGQYYKKRFPNDCQKFYFCRNGSLEIWICNTFYNFDAKTLACKIFWDVDCSIGT
ncbi:mucin-2 [Nilaparvata lugens]|uniref:mucin-2 n=1 Tax=Nilaparvata lugens TaxID=108931 RepID=UPI00193E9560|nr:mucin-2 [Nilaparvata lugens]